MGRIIGRVLLGGVSHFLTLMFKRNLNPFSLNAIVDIRLRRHEIFFLNISETTRAINFSNHPNVAHDSLYISTANYVKIYFRSAANRTNVSILGHVRVGLRFLDLITVQSLSKKVYSFGKCESWASSLFCDASDIFASWSIGPTVVKITFLLLT